MEASVVTLLEDTGVVPAAVTPELVVMSVTPSVTGEHKKQLIIMI